MVLFRDINPIIPQNTKTEGSYFPRLFTWCWLFFECGDGVIEWFSDRGCCDL